MPAGTVEALRDCEHCSIRAVSVCSALSHADLDRFESLGQQVTLPRRAVLFSEGQPAEVVYSIKSGVARVSRLLVDGSRQVVGFGLPGDFLGLPVDERHSCSADASELMTACRFSRQSFLTFMDERPHFMQRICDSTARDLDLARDQMLLLGRSDARTRVAAFLINMRERWSRTRTMSATVSLPMGRQDIGDFLGLSIATVSRLLNRLAREGLILIVPRGVRILDLPRLQRLARI
jgi:CRP/FNR family transcriptional regulator